MFVCRGCLRSLTGATAGPVGARLLGPLQKRAASSIPNRRPYTGRGIGADLRSTIETSSQPGAQRSPSKGKGTSGEKPPGDDNEDLEYENFDTRGGDHGRKLYEKKLESNIKRHLSLTPDPYHIAQSVAGMLERNRFDEALMMARMASRNNKVEVSWNHLIDYQLKNHRLHAAVKLYNEVRICLLACSRYTVC